MILREMKLKIAMLSIAFNTVYGTRLVEKDPLIYYRKVRALRGIIRHVEEGNTIGM